VATPTLRKWESWRGSPEHVAQIVRVGLETLGAGTTWRMALGRGSYRETFATLSQFRAASTEAFMDCTRIWIAFENQRHCIYVRFKLATWKKNAGVKLLVYSSEDVEAPPSRVLPKLSAAIDRGRVPARDKWILGAVSWIVLVVTTASLSFLVHRIRLHPARSAESLVIIQAGAGLLGVVLSAVGGLAAAAVTAG
jgi:hypothetical protein